MVAKKACAVGVAEGRCAEGARRRRPPKGKWPFPPRNRYHMDRNRYHMDRTATIWAERGAPSAGAFSARSEPKKRPNQPHKRKPGPARSRRTVCVRKSIILANVFISYHMQLSPPG